MSPEQTGPSTDPSSEIDAPSAPGPAPSSAVDPGTPASPLADVRGELRRLGYLDHQVERFLLQDALRPERPWRAAWHLAVKVGLLIGLPAALLATLVLAGVEGHLARSPFDVLPLFLHLLVPCVALISLGFLGFALLLAALLRFWHVRRIEAASFGLALASAALSVAAALAVGRAYLAVLGRWQATVLALAVPVLAWVVWKSVHGGLLTLAIRLTDQAPEGRPGQRGRWGVLALLGLTFLVMLPAALDAGRSEPAAPANLPISDAGAVAVIGVDGVLPAEVDYLVGRGELGSLAELAPAGVWIPYLRPEEAPIAFWASVATGLPSPRHGMGSVDTFRPLGMSLPLRRSGWARPYWAVLARLGLAEYRPVLANNRNAFAFWELASRGGAPSLVINWWGTFPADPAPGALVAHGAFQLLGTGSAEGAVHPPELGRELAELLAREADGPLSDPLAVPGPLVEGIEDALGATAAAGLVERALAPDLFYRRLFLDPLATGWPLRAVYLPGLDIASVSAELDSVLLADLIRWQLRGVNALVAGLPDTVDTLLLVLDPGRRGSGEGRAFLWRRQGCGGGTPAVPASPDEPIAAERLAAALLRALGLPQSAELPPPPEACALPEPSLVVGSYGRRHPPEARVEGREYLLSLQSLGYL